MNISPPRAPASRPRLTGLVLTITVMAAFLGAAMATEACVEVKSTNVSRGESIRLLYDDPGLEDVVKEAIELWKHCPNYGASFPALVDDEEASRTIQIQSFRFRSNGRRACGTRKGDLISLYDWFFTRSGEAVSCGPLAPMLAHELGHVLGLRDAPDEAICTDSIMADVNPNEERQVSTQECQAVGQRWLTDDELLRSSSTDVGEGGA